MKKTLIVILLFIFATIAILTNSSFRNNNNNSIEISDGISFDGTANTGNKLSKDEEYIEIYGYKRIYVNKDSKNIDLVNPKSNSVYFRYIIKINGIEIYKSDYIKPGEKISWNAYECFDKKGNFNTTFEIETLDIASNSICNGAILNVIAIVE